ncbi:MAG: DUF1638 domain-containing protein [Acidimicrobiaceae bacterium]|nr:DUF1638 domain-containing protein [Acidimicrobiaceae bacterium]MYD08157.1 DUF1638 domain-containing protein [Acidimicrobiaceae bacterium]MYI60008.1 DUF1638 domain-containing protein [Acidimicrobiaceae bacterium]
MTNVGGPANPSGASTTNDASDAPQVLILACGALAREIRDISRLHQLDNITLECLPASLHNRPENIGEAVRQRLTRGEGKYDRILLGYADCGTSGELVDLCREYQDSGTTIEMMPGAHCYQFFAGGPRFDSMHDNDPTAFYLTDYLVKHFERIIMGGLGIEAHPELRDMYFGNYTKLIYLAQTDDPVLDEKARAAADRLGLAFERLSTGHGELETQIFNLAREQTVAL